MTQLCIAALQKMSAQNDGMIGQIQTIVPCHHCLWSIWMFSKFHLWVL